MLLDLSKLLINLVITSNQTTLATQTYLVELDLVGGIWRDTTTNVSLWYGFRE